MLRALIFVAFMIGAYAFNTGSYRTRQISTLKMNYEAEIGTLPPVGFFDPLGLAKDIDTDTFIKYRTAELKHGRVCMLAVLGYIVPEVFRFPGNVGGIAFSDIPNGIQALGALPGFGWFQIGASVSSILAFMISV